MLLNWKFKVCLGLIILLPSIVLSYLIAAAKRHVEGSYMFVLAYSWEFYTFWYFLHIKWAIQRTLFLSVLYHTDTEFLHVFTRMSLYLKWKALENIEDEDVTWLMKKTDCRTTFRIRPLQSHDALFLLLHSCIGASSDSCCLKGDTHVTYRGNLYFWS